MGLKGTYYAFFSNLYIVLECQMVILHQLVFGHLLQEKHDNVIQGQAHPSVQSVYWYRGDLQQPNQDPENIQWRKCLLVVLLTSSVTYFPCWVPPWA